MNLEDLPHFKNLLSKRVKLVRHQNTGGLIPKLKAHNQLEIYQELQTKPVFHGCELIVGFIGEAGSASRLLGVYRVDGFDGPRIHEPILGYLDQTPISVSRPHYRYQLTKQPGFEDFEDRLVVDWGKSTRSWHQWLKGSSKEIIEISPKGYLKPFPGYEDFILTYGELKKLFANPSANREWRDLLQATAGIYLILDTKSGKQYVGSASGESGIWGRWQAYSDNGHGGNMKLIALQTTSPEASHRFEFSILRTLPRSMARKTVIGYEKHYKEKLGSRAFGLNLN